MSIDLSQFIPSFLEESFEGLELMETGLLNLQVGDNEAIHSIFRAAHSIKGGAGTFGFNNVTEFTHLVETLLDEMRDGRREITPSDIETLLASVDCIRLLIEAVRDDESYDKDKILKVSSKLTSTLNDSTPNNDVNIAADTSIETEELVEYTINFVPELSLAKTGNDPLFLFSALSDLGELSISASTSDLPALTDIDVQELYLSWEVKLKTSATVTDIREIFEWVEDECILEISINSLEEKEAKNNTGILLDDSTLSIEDKTINDSLTDETPKKKVIALQLNLRVKWR